jgi:hypothetical protein
MCDLIFSTNFVWNISYFKKIQRDIVINERGSSFKIPIIVVRFWLQLNFSRYIFEKSSNIKFREYSSSGSPDLLWRQADTTKLRVASRNFANAPKSACDYQVGIATTQSV